MNLHRGFKALLAVVAAAALFGATATDVAAQQTGTVEGVVTDAQTGQPIAGVQVLVVGTQRGTLSGQDGSYTIRGVPTGNREIRATRLGFRGETEAVVVPADGTATASFALRTAAVELEGVVVNPVTGRSERRRELGTNTASIQVEDINLAQVTSFQDVLTGRAAGVNMQGASGTIGTGQRIRIRGANSISLSNEPLVYIDGVRMNTSQGGFGVGGQNPSRLNDLNPNDIEGIEVLKGPAASALYGTAGANGVILITTRRGRSGDARWNVFAETTDLRDMTDYPANHTAWQVRDGGDPNAHPYIVPGFGAGGAGFFNTTDFALCRNYQAAAGQCVQEDRSSFNVLMDPRTRPFQTGNRMRYGANVAGGADGINYYLSGDIEDQQGIMQHNESQKGSFRGNLQAQLREDLSVQVSTGYVNSQLALNSNDNSIFSPLINGLLGTPQFIDYREEFDTVPAPASNMNYGWGFGPDDLANLPTRQDVDRVTIGVNSAYTPLEWLSANANLGLDFTARHDHSDIEPMVLPIGGSYNLGFRQSGRSNQYLWTAGLSGTGSFDLTPDIQTTTTLGTQFERSLFEYTYCFGAGTVVGTRSCGATAEQFSVNESFSEVVTIGGYLQQRFAFADRLFITGSLRADDTSAFGDQFDLAWFPGLSASWVTTEEPWFPVTNAVSELRLRAAFGTSGLRPGFRQAETLFGPIAVTRDGEDVSGVTLSSTGNPLLSPERTTEYELGFDAGFFQDRVGLEFTYFNKTSRDALIARRLPPSLGLTGSVFDNLGAVQNSGTELAANITAFELPNARLGLRVSHSTLSNEILDMAGEEPIPFGRGTQRHQEGYPAGAFFQPPVEWDVPDTDRPLGLADVRLVTDEDGDPLGPQFIGPSLPTWTMSLGGDLALWDFLAFGTLFEARGGNYQMNSTGEFRCRTGNAWGTGCAAVWDPSAPLEEQAKFLASAGYGSNALWIEPADFIKWREFSVSLGVPQQLATNVRLLDGATLTVAGRNLATWTDYTGLDPEIQETGGSGNFTQNEFNTQPPLRNITVRLNFAF